MFTEDESDLRLKRHDVIIDMTPKGRTTLTRGRFTEEPVLYAKKITRQSVIPIDMEQFLVT
ncbi:hypothetical protein OH492_17470 [Vibrio chagasii]|nr:hypothetical protein [Vibrio chagasii]